MASSDLSQYIADARNRGSSDGDTRAVLLRAGWKAEDVDSALKPSPQAVASPVVNSAPAEAAIESFHAASLGGGSKKSIWKILVPVLIVLALALGGGVAYKAELLPFGKTVSDVELIAQLGDSVSGINSAAYSISLTITSEPREADAKPIQIPEPSENVSGAVSQFGLAASFFNQNTLFAFLPTDVRITLGASGTMASSDVSTDARFEFGSEVQFGDFAASAAAAF